MPSISVVIPTFNDASYLTRVLDSVLLQTRRPDEVIIIDDGSTDGTAAIAMHIACLQGFTFESGWTVLPCRSNRGAGAARNTGILAATSQWIAFLDADDEWMPNKLQEVEEAIDHWDCNIVCHSEQHNNGPVEYYSGRLLSDSYHRSVFSTSAVTVRKDLLVRVGLFDESIRSGLEDFDLWQRLAPYAKPVFIRTVLGRYHSHPGNLTNGRYYAKWRDSMRLAWRYRNRVTIFDMIARIGVATVQYGGLGIKDFTRKAIACIKRSTPSIQPDNSQ